MGYRLNRLDEPVFMAVSKPLLTEFGIDHWLESCESPIPWTAFAPVKNSSLLRYLLRWWLELFSIVHFIGTIAMRCIQFITGLLVFVRSYGYLLANSYVRIFSYSNQIICTISRFMVVLICLIFSVLSTINEYANFANETLFWMVRTGFNQPLSGMVMQKCRSKIKKQ